MHKVALIVLVFAWSYAYYSGAYFAGILHLASLCIVILQARDHKQARVPPIDYNHAQLLAQGYADNWSGFTREPERLQGPSKLRACDPVWDASDDEYKNTILRRSYQPGNAADITIPDNDTVDMLGIEIDDRYIELGIPTLYGGYDSPSSYVAFLAKSSDFYDYAMEAMLIPFSCDAVLPESRFFFPSAIFREPGMSGILHAMNIDDSDINLYLSRCHFKTIATYDDMDGLPCWKEAYALWRAGNHPCQ